MENENTKNQLKSLKSKKMQNNDKKACQYIVTKKENNIIIGRKCCDLVIENDKCKNHQHCKERQYDKLIERVCMHVITQKSKGKDRSGMICGKFLYNESSNFCSDHIKRHSDNSNSCLRSFKVRCYPKKSQQQYLSNFFGAARYTYNKCVEDDVELKFDEARNKYVTTLPKLKEFLKKTPKAIREFAVREYITGKKNAEKRYEDACKLEEWRFKNWKNYKKRKIKKPKMKFKRKKLNQCIMISKDSVKISNNKIIICEHIFKNDHLKLRNQTVKKDKKLKQIFKQGYVNHDIKIMKTVTNKYYLIFPVDIQKKSVCQPVTLGANDPGVKTPATIYSEDKVIELGINMISKLKPLIEKRDILLKKYKLALNKRPMNIEEFVTAKMKYKKYIEKLNNKINNFHYQMITKLMEYDLLFYPKLNVKSILMEKDLPKIVKRILVLERHSTLRKRCCDKADQLGKIVIKMSEYMTSQTCGRCFETYKFTGDTYHCNKCNLVISRDINSARTMYLLAFINSLTKVY